MPAFGRAHRLDQRQLELIENSWCSDGDSGADDERMNGCARRRLRGCPPWGSFQSSSCEMIVGTTADHVHRVLVQPVPELAHG